ncbi:SGNH/GDSL hydrolase family protein [Gloeothece verrucosa]|uniref:Lipolytic protein G-D-S-L family n=1 Tax=Gloeothece verrucosa (strain PCC 7822) TaxID=497965 RepID=E0ULQ0_GLOV7|nr:SGNH/GDSL hydrolase family protein [Gloeothece verrucosa]ADN17880.1 lipolytic protein G-D-S-L family [Gloeothece verrucosa PCC 7822]
MIMKSKVITTGLCLLSFIFPIKTLAANFEAVYAFGDSYLDVGNYYNYTKNIFGSGFPPQPYYEGRLTNGNVWAEYLAQDLNLSPNSNNNFAVLGATSGLYNAVAPSSIPSLYLTGVLSQINNFLGTTPSVNPNALYIVSGGFNDLFVSNGTIDINEPVMNILTGVRNLALGGAKNILVANLPNLGDLPGTINSEISNQLNKSTIQYNASLAQSIHALKSELNQVNIVSLDINGLFNQVFANPDQFGFKDVTGSCLGNTVIGALPASDLSSLCGSNPNQVFFWDSIHPTTTAHKLIAEYAVSVLEEPQAIPEPSPEVRIWGIIALLIVSTTAVRRQKT